jgi:hypothetical protein
MPEANLTGVAVRDESYLFETNESSAGGRRGEALT